MTKLYFPKRLSNSLFPPISFLGNTEDETKQKVRKIFSKG